jgi:hypothetical protein
MTRTIETRVTVDEQGIATLQFPPDITPGEHKVVVVIEEAKAKTSLSFSSHDVGKWPEGFQVRREEIYDDDGR